MKNNFSLKFKLFDIFILAFATIFIVASIIITNVVFSNSLKDDNKVLIYYQNEIVQQIDLKDVDNEMELILSKDEYEGLLGDIHILINKDKGICISDVTCPNHYCEKQGWIKKVGYPIVCLPNGIYVMISSPSPDEDIILG